MRSREYYTGRDGNNQKHKPYEVEGRGSGCREDSVDSHGPLAASTFLYRQHTDDLHQPLLIYDPAPQRMAKDRGRDWADEIHLHGGGSDHGDGRKGVPVLDDVVILRSVFIPTGIGTERGDGSVLCRQK